MLSENDLKSNPIEKAAIFNTVFAMKASIEGSDDSVPDIPETEDSTVLNMIHTDYLEIGPNIMESKLSSYSYFLLPTPLILNQYLIHLGNI